MQRRDRQSLNRGRLEQKSLLINIGKSHLNNTVLLEQRGLINNRDLLNENGPHNKVLLERSLRQIHFLVPDLQDLVDGQTPPTDPHHLISQTLVHIIREFIHDLCCEHVTLCTYCICTFLTESVRLFDDPWLGMNGPEAPGCFDSGRHCSAIVTLSMHCSLAPLLLRYMNPLRMNKNPRGATTCSLSPSLVAKVSQSPRSSSLFSVT